MRLQGKVALITGGAAAVKGELMGFGGAAAWFFVREGAKVALTDVNDDLGQKAVSQLRASGHDAIYLNLDVTKERDWLRAIQSTVSAFGGLDILVNNAGTGSPYTVEDTTEEVWDEQMAVHAKGTFLGTKQALPEMRKRGGGSVINVSSVFGLIGSPASAAYHAAKGAVRLFTKAAAIQYAKDNIRVNSVHPGYALTPMTRRLFTDDPEQLNVRVARVPMGRLANAEEIAYGILYLASDESSFVTGSELVIDGGMTAQ
jgi:cyclopentanol dehydrogenase